MKTGPKISAPSILHRWAFFPVALACAFGSFATAQQAHSTDGHIPMSTDAIGAGDLLDVSVPYCPELTHTFRVGANGLLALPLLHTPITVSGDTPQQLALRIAAELRNEHVLVDPVVNVSILELQSRPVSVVGAVNHPLTFQANSHTTLIDAIARAEGLSSTAGGTIVVTSKRSDGTSSVNDISVPDLFSGNFPAANRALHGGEEVRVLEAHKVFVAGNVRRPGMYPMQSDSDTTVMKALALSSGLDQYSSNTAFIYRKTPGSAERKKIEIPLKLIMKRRAPDVALAADDILYFPTNDGRRLTGKILSEIAGFGQTAEAGLLVTY